MFDSIQWNMCMRGDHCMIQPPVHGSHPPQFNGYRHTWLHCIPAIQPHHNCCPSIGWEHPTLHTVSVATDCVPFRIRWQVSAVFTVICCLHYVCMSTTYIIAEPESKATNLDTQVAKCLYVYMYICPSQSVTDTSLVASKLYP